MRGPGASLYSDEVEAAEAVDGFLGTLAELGVKLKLGHLPDEYRHDLTDEQALFLKKRRIDILRVMLAREMVAEAQQLERKYILPDYRTGSNGRRYGDLMFSARALLPPGYDWDKVTYEGAEGLTCWSHQLSYDRNGKTLEGVRYSSAEAELLLDEFKGDDRVIDEEVA